ncbi:MAG: hypothetical protein K2O18_06315 [Oscillospiraceae bacterium]|nr:hypothetical protein [Oscillospiraceae bacterium]
MNDFENGTMKTPGPTTPDGGEQSAVSHNADAYASKMMLSLSGSDSRDTKVQRDLYEQLRTLWHTVNDPFPKLLDSMGITAEACSVRFCVPSHVIQEWCESRRDPPLYVRLMMAEAVGLVTLRGYPVPRQMEIAID